MGDSVSTAFVAATVSVLTLQGHADDIKCGYTICDSSFQACDYNLDDCFGCENYCLNWPQHCHVTCPEYNAKRLATTTTSSSPSTSDITSVSVEPTGDEVSPDSQNLIVIALSVSLSVMFLIIVGIIGYVCGRNKCLSHRIKWSLQRHNRENQGSPDTEAGDVVSQVKFSQMYGFCGQIDLNLKLLHRTDYLYRLIL